MATYAVRFACHYYPELVPSGSSELDFNWCIPLHKTPTELLIFTNRFWASVCHKSQGEVVNHINREVTRNIFICFQPF